MTGNNKKHVSQEESFPSQDTPIVQPFIIEDIAEDNNLNNSTNDLNEISLKSSEKDSVKSPELLSEKENDDDGEMAFYIPTIPTRFGVGY